MSSLYIALSLVATIAFAAAQVRGPGLGNLSYDENEWMKGICVIAEGDPNGPPRGGVQRYGTNIVHMIDGYMMSLFAPDGTLTPGGLIFWDVSNPRQPIKVSTLYEPTGRTKDFREAHSFGFSMIDGRRIAVFHTRLGIETWDLTDIFSPARLGKLDFMPGGGYVDNPFDFSYQHPYVYAAVANRGVAIIDVSDLQHPKLAERGGGRPNPIPISELGGFLVGPIDVFGNLLVITSMNGAAGYAVLDLGDPLNPSLLSSISSNPNGRYYYTGFDGRYVTASVMAGRATDTGAMTIHDIADPNEIKLVSSGPYIGGMLYNTSQDNFLFHGMQSAIAKLDVANPAQPVLLGLGSIANVRPIDIADFGQVTVAGNLLWVGNDHGTGSGFAVHQIEPDTTPPVVRHINPPADATDVAICSRVGISFTDNILLESLTPAAIELMPVLPSGGFGASVEGVISGSEYFVNFSPNGDLQPDTTYVLEVKAGGIADWAGNSIAAAFESTFTTSSDCALNVVPPSPISYWDFEENADDQIGDNHGSLVSGATVSDGALVLDSGWMEATNGLTIPLGIRGSISLLLATTQQGSATPETAPGLLGYRTELGSRGFYMGWIDEAGHIVVSAEGGGAIRSSHPVNDGEPHHIVMTRNGFSGIYSLWVDGVLEGKQVIDSFYALWFNVPEFSSIGRMNDAIGLGGTPLRGTIDEIKSFHFELEDEQVAALRADVSIEIQRVPTSQPGGEVSFVADTAAIGGGFSYSWDFGDGSPRTEPSSVPTASHTFDEIGRYQVRLVVRRSLSESSVAYWHVVNVGLTPGVPTKSSTIAHDGDGRVLVVNPDNSTLSCLDATSHALLYEVPTGDSPEALALPGTGEVWIATRDSSEVVVHRLVDGVELRTVSLPAGSQPSGICATPDGGSVFVALEASGEVAKIDTDSAAVERFDVGPSPRGLAVNHDSSRLYVTRFISPDSGGVVSEWDADTFELIREFVVEADDETLDDSFSARGVPNYLRSIAISPDGSQALVAAKSDNIFRGVQRDGKELTFESTVRPTTLRLALNGFGVGESGIAFDHNDAAMPSDIVFSPSGEFAFVALQGSDTIEVIDAYAFHKLGGAENTGSAPRGLAMSPDGSRLYVHNFLSRSVTVYDTTGVRDSTTFAMVRIGEFSLVGNEVLSADELRGKRLFYNSTDVRIGRDRYISCAACHDDGGQDGRVWDFSGRGEGLRNTVSLKGRRGAGHGNLHWSGNFDEIQDFEGDMRNHFAGGGFLTDEEWNDSRSDSLGEPKAGLSEDLDALASYLESLDKVGTSPHRGNDGSLTAQGLAGRTHFTSLGCASCHGGEDFTISSGGGLFDIGTITATSGSRLGEMLLGLDVPTLKGLWADAPYLHDGSAASLREVLTTRNPDGKHGAVASLSSTQIDELVAYLSQIDDHEPAPQEVPLILPSISGLPAVGILARGEQFWLGLDEGSIPDGAVQVEFYAGGDLVGVGVPGGDSVSWTPVGISAL